MTISRYTESRTRWPPVTQVVKGKVMSSSEVQFDGEPHYIEGYVPVSLDSPHSSLHSSKTWSGMGLILASLALYGVGIFGLATEIFGGQEWSTYLLYGGFISGTICLFLGFGLIHAGRAPYREYVKRTGRIH